MWKLLRRKVTVEMISYLGRVLLQALLGMIIGAAAAKLLLLPVVIYSVAGAAAAVVGYLIGSLVEVGIQYLIKRTEAATVLRLVGRRLPE